MISLIAAVAQNYTIGKDGDLPWRLPSDLKWFKANTVGKPCIMGRKTYASLGRPLPNRRNMVVTRNTDFAADGVEVFHGIDNALDAADAEEIMILGGSTIYEKLLPRADRFYLTVVLADVEGDTHFPPLAPDDWEVVSLERHEPDERHAHAYNFVVLDRVGHSGEVANGLPSEWR